jgi:uncharacterized protein YndB with AHSA1/START domain
MSAGAIVPDRIVQSTVLRAPLERVWGAVSESERFGAWFGMRTNGPFVAGAHLEASIAPTTVDPEVAKLQKPHEGKRFVFIVDRVEPPRRIAFRWHPFAIDPKVDYSKEPTTLIEFVLEGEEEGTRLTITESGFDRIPLARRAEAYRANEGGWAHQLEMVRKYLEG